MDTINKTNLQLLKAKLLEAMKPIAEDLELHIEFGNGTFNDSNATLKLKIALIGDNGNILSKEEIAFEQMSWAHKMPASALGSRFRSQGRFYTITGYNSRAHKMPINAKRDDGKPFKFTVNYVKAALLAEQ